MVEGERPIRVVLLRLLWAVLLIHFLMTRLEGVLGVLLLLAACFAVVAQRRNRALQRKHKVLQHLYDQAEQQLSTFWTSKKP